MTHLPSCHRFCTKSLTGHSDWVRKLAVNADSSVFASCSSDQSIILWSYPACDTMGVLRGHEHVVECIAFCGDYHDTTIAHKAKVSALAVSAMCGSCCYMVHQLQCGCSRSSSLVLHCHRRCHLVVRPSPSRKGLVSCLVQGIVLSVCGIPPHAKPSSSLYVYTLTHTHTHVIPPLPAGCPRQLGQERFFSSQRTVCIICG